jgi:lipopolysaccharide transport system ATP-binding protein
MSRNPAIVIEQLSKVYTRGHLRKRDLKGTMASWRSMFRPKQQESFYALKEIDLTIAHGDVVGIVGANGAGKSTLLKLLSRITYPSHGRMTIYGTLSSMLEVGTGFHPELTGRENIFLNGAIIGMKRAEISRKLDSIIAFSGIEEFIDTPVKHYSSGMYVRLAFAVASHLEPDILLIDEVLAVGDHAFRRKCMDKLLDVSSQGRTVIIVSHQMAYLKELCKSGIFLDHGALQFAGPIDETITRYTSFIEGHVAQHVSKREDRRGAGQVQITGFQMLDEQGNSITSAVSGQSVRFQIKLQRRQPEARNIVVQMECVDMYGQLCFVANNSFSDSSLESMSDTVALECFIPRLPLNAQTYFINASVTVSLHLADEVKNVLTIDVEPGMFYKTGKLPAVNSGFLVDYSWRVK